MSILFLQFLLDIMFLTLVFMHLTKKNSGVVFAYFIQSLIIVIILLNSFFETRSIYVLFIVLLTLVVKLILAPLFFRRLIKKHTFTFSIKSNLNTPFTLVIIVILASIAHSQKLALLTHILPANQVLLSLALSAMFLSLFLIVNNKGALSQAVGILSLENSIVAFIIFAGLEQSPGLQAGITFNIFVWTVVATVFMSMIYKHFGSYDVTNMKKLKD